MPTAVLSGEDQLGEVRPTLDSVNVFTLVSVLLWLTCFLGGNSDRGQNSESFINTLHNPRVFPTYQSIMDKTRKKKT